MGIYIGTQASGEPKMEEASSSRADKFVSKIDFNGTNVDAAWKKFKAQFRIYALAKGYGAKQAEEQVANMLVLMGAESVPIYEQFVFPSSTPSLEDVKKAFDEYFEPVKNIIFERVKFNRLTQESTQTIHQYITAVQSQADLCDYGTMKSELIRDRIVVGVRDTKLQEYLIDVDKLDMAMCIQKAKQYVSHHKQAQLFNKGGADQNIDAIQPRVKKLQDKSKVKKRDEDAGTCEYCGRSAHPRDKCPAKEATCFRCKEKGHYGRSTVCKKLTKAKPVQEVNLSEQSDDEESLYMGSLL